jgi:P27 family predicted phage terminase small subunit
MIREIEPLGILTKLDKAVFAIYCQAYSTWVQATRKIQEMGMVRITKNGYTEQNPFFPIANKAKEQMMKALVELGMTPSSRSRIKVMPKKEESPEDEFLKGIK